jgi:hypothetical protein
MKSGYGRLIALMKRQNQSSPMMALAVMESATVVNYKGIKLDKDDYYFLDTNMNPEYSGSSSDGASITIKIKDDKTTNLKKGDVVLIYELETDDDPKFIIMGKVVM